MDTSSLTGFGIVLAAASFLLCNQFRSKVPQNSTPKADAALDELAALRQQCQRLRDELATQRSLLLSDIQRATFEQLQSLLTSYPTACQMAEAKPDLPAKNLIALFTPLENWLHSNHIEAIGTPWQAVAYDPQLHNPDQADLVAGESVYIRFVGYRQGDRILCPAQVSRTRPGQG